MYPPQQSPSSLVPISGENHSIRMDTTNTHLFCQMRNVQPFYANLASVRNHSIIVNGYFDLPQRQKDIIATDYFFLHVECTYSDDPYLPVNTIISSPLDSSDPFMLYIDNDNSQLSKNDFTRQIKRQIVGGCHILNYLVSVGAFTIPLPDNYADLRLFLRNFSDLYYDQQSKKYTFVMKNNDLVAREHTQTTINGKYLQGIRIAFRLYENNLIYKINPTEVGQSTQKQAHIGRLLGLNMRGVNYATIQGADYRYYQNVFQLLPITPFNVSPMSIQYARTTSTAAQYDSQWAYQLLRMESRYLPYTTQSDHYPIKTSLVNRQMDLDTDSQMSKIGNITQTIVPRSVWNQPPNYNSNMQFDSSFQLIEDAENTKNFHADLVDNDGEDTVMTDNYKVNFHVKIQ